MHSQSVVHRSQMSMLSICVVFQETAHLMGQNLSPLLASRQVAYLRATVRAGHLLPMTSRAVTRSPPSSFQPPFCCCWTCWRAYLWNHLAGRCLRRVILSEARKRRPSRGLGDRPCTPFGKSIQRLASRITLGTIPLDPPPPLAPELATLRCSHLISQSRT